MKKIPCDIIRDLLPLYEDNICSETSRHEIEKHLTECKNCQEYYNLLHEKLPPVTLPSASTGKTDSRIRGANGSSDEESEFIKNIYRRLNRRQLITVITCGIIILVILVLSIANESPGIHEYLQKIPVFDRRIDTEKIKVTELYQLKNGDIYVTLESTQPFSIASFGFEPSSENISPFSSYSNGLAILSLQRSFWSELSNYSSVAMSECSFVLPLKETELIEGENELLIHESSSIYFEGKGDQRLLLWTCSQEPNPAPDAVEEKVYRACHPKTNSDSSTVQDSLQNDSEAEHIFIYDDKMY